MRAILLGGLTATVAAFLPFAPGASALAEATGPALEAPPGDLEAALECPDAFGGPGEPVLLVHGTYSTPEENWSWNFGAALPEMGFDVCTVRLPDRSTGDIQVSSEYVVFAIREIAARSGEPVDVLGHSQGSLQPRWALKWWPDTRALVDDLVMMAGPNHGTALADLAYEFGCHPSCYQMATGSNFMAALNAGDETPGEVDYTSLYSVTDELVQPAFPPEAATAAIDGAVNVALQDLCPGRPGEHAAMAADAAIAAAVLDALTHDGPFDVTRFDPLTCAQAWMDGFDPSAFPELLGDNALTDLFGRPDFGAPGQEPPLKPYAQGGGESGGSDDSSASEGGGGGVGVAGEEVRAGEVTPATGGLPPLALAALLIVPIRLGARFTRSGAR